MFERDDRSTHQHQRRRGLRVTGTLGCASGCGWMRLVTGHGTPAADVLRGRCGGEIVFVHMPTSNAYQLTVVPE